MVLFKKDDEAAKRVLALTGKASDHLSGMGTTWMTSRRNYCLPDRIFSGEVSGSFYLGEAAWGRDALKKDKGPFGWLRASKAKWIKWAALVAELIVEVVNCEWIR